jgi:hypothetical protein
MTRKGHTLDQQSDRLFPVAKCSMANLASDTAHHGKAANHGNSCTAA